MAKKTKATKRELGAGVAAVFGGRKPTLKSKEEAQELVAKLEHTVAMLPLEKIHPNAEQPRRDFDEDALKELSESIKIHGIIQPITVRSMGDGTFQIISGERRFQASKATGLKEIPAYVRITADGIEGEKELLEMALVENIQREDLNPVEMADSLYRLKYLDSNNVVSDENIAKQIGKSRSTVTGYLRVYKLIKSANNQTIEDSLRNGEISMGHAKELALLPSEEAREFYTALIDNNWSVRELENAIRAKKEAEGKTKTLKPKAALPTEYQAVVNSLREKFGSKKINIKLKKDGKGQIMMPFNSTEELNRFLDAMES